VALSSFQIQNIVWKFLKVGSPLKIDSQFNIFKSLLLLNDSVVLVEGSIWIDYRVKFQGVQRVLFLEELTPFC